MGHTRQLANLEGPITCEFIDDVICRKPACHFWINVEIPTVYAQCEQHNGKISHHMAVWERWKMGV